MRCKVVVPPKMFMCKRHWYMVPKAMRERIWDLYVPGQELRKDPTLDYLAVTNKAIELVAAKEA
jgi:hypothetical protein